MTAKTKNNTLRSQSGFTLIELIVVMAIITLLASIILTSTVAARRQARNAKRIADAQQIRNGLELFRTIHGRLPRADHDFFSPNGAPPGEKFLERTDFSNVYGFIDELELSGAMATVPIDPQNARFPNFPVYLYFDAQDYPGDVYTQAELEQPGIFCENTIKSSRFALIFMLEQPADPPTSATYCNPTGNLLVCYICQ